MKSLKEMLNDGLQNRKDESLTREDTTCTVDMSRDPFTQNLQQMSSCLDDIDLMKN